MKQVMESLHTKEITCFKEARECFEIAQRLRCVGSTSMNAKSSRSHAIFILSVLNTMTDVRSTLYLVDLAGSERIKKSNVSGERIDEAIAINSSLTTLGKCIIALGEKKVGHVPFRESKLTKILQDALGGRCKTALILTLSPELEDLEETVSSLLFGQRAKKVQIKIMPTESLTPKTSVEEYKKQLEMKTQLLYEVSAENKRLQAEIRSLVSEQTSKKDESYLKLEAKMKLMKKEHQTKLEDMDALMLKQEKEISRLREKLANAGVNAYSSKENQYMSNGPEEVSKRLKFSEPNLLQEISKNKENLRTNNKSGRKGTHDGTIGALRAGSTSPTPNHPTSKPLRVCLEEFLAEDTTEMPQLSQMLQTKQLKPTNAVTEANEAKTQEKLQELNSKYSETCVKLEEAVKRVKELETELSQHKQDQQMMHKANKLLVEENDQLISEHRKGIHVANEQPMRPDLLEEIHSQLTKHRARLQEVEEENNTLKMEINYLKEFAESLESENQALEEELVMAKEPDLEELRKAVLEADTRAQEFKEETEKLKQKTSQLAAENYTMADENIKMAKTISELKEREGRMAKEISSLEDNLVRLSTIQPKDEGSLNIGLLTNSKGREDFPELVRLKTLESEAERWRRRDEEKEYKIASLQNDLAAAETQSRISKMRSDEMAHLNQALEDKIKQVESEFRDNLSHKEDELDRLRRQLAEGSRERHRLGDLISHHESEVKRLKDVLGTADQEKRELEAILSQYRHQEQMALTSDQELERLKGVLLESDNWNSVRPSSTQRESACQPASLEIIMQEAKLKIHEFISALVPPGSEAKHIPTKPVLKAGMDTLLKVPKQSTRKILTSYFTQVYFFDFEKSILSVSSGKQLQQTLVREYSKARKCLRELATAFEDVLMSVMEHEYLARVEEMRLTGIENKLGRFRKVLQDPEFEMIRLQFLQICTAPIRQKYAAVKIQSFFKRIRQQKRMVRLQKRHKSQYERFQAGSGKNLLQMLMKTTEGAFCEFYEKLGPIEEDFKVLQKRKTKGPN